MAEIKGYLLTEEETNACVNLVKKMRERKTFSVDFSGRVRIKAQTADEASDIFYEWVGDLQDKTLADWHRVIRNTPYFDIEMSEEE